MKYGERGETPPNPTNKGWRDKVRELKVNHYFEAPSSIRSRFYTDFKVVGRKCAIRVHPEDATLVRVYRIK